jgi:hypothetical protein
MWATYYCQHVCLQVGGKQSGGCTGLNLQFGDSHFI